jgi:flagellar hook-associated protein 2
VGSALPSGTFTTLSQVGVQFKTDGTLSFDSAKLVSALKSNSTAVTQLFAAVGTATDALVSVPAFTDKTVPGTYAVSVTQLARQASLAGSDVAGLTITAGANDQLTVNVDGVSTTITLAPATYASASALAAEVQGKINGATALSAASTTVTVKESGGTFTITSNRYGSGSQVSVSGTAAATVLGAAPVATAGLDIIGTIGGFAATGSGQTLTGDAGSAVEGLKLAFSGGSAGDRGTVTFGRGFAYLLDQLITNVLAKDGTIASRSSGLQKTVDTVKKNEDAFNKRMEKVEANYFRQFNALDALLSSLSAQSSYLTQQFDTLAALTKQSAK